MADEIAAHDQAESHHYVVHLPPHPAPPPAPPNVAIDHYHRKTRAAARCYVGERIGFGYCRDAQGRPCPPPGGGQQPGLELHHAHVEFSLQNGIDLAALEKDFPGISDATSVGAWVESDVNFRWLCCEHHRGPGGAHTASHSDWEASQYVPGLIAPNAA
jgi:hypothetical protein